MKGGVAVAVVVLIAGCGRRPLEYGASGAGSGSAGAAAGPGAGGASGSPDEVGCLPSSALVTCGPAPIDATRVKSFALGASDTEVGLSWIEENDEGDTWLSFSRLSPHLELAGTVALDDTRQPGPVSRGALAGTAVASLASRWVVAVCGLPQIFIETLDATGMLVGRTVVSYATETVGACISGTPALAARPGGGALMAWETSDGGVQIAMIAADGLSVGAPQTIITDVPFADTPAAAWIGDAFYVVSAVSASTGGLARALRIVRITPDGSATTIGDILAGQARDAPGVAVGASDLRVGFEGTMPPSDADPTAADSGVFWQELGLTGQALTPVVTLGRYPYWGRPAAVAFDGDAVILIGGFNGQLGLVRVASDGEIVTPLTSFFAAPATTAGPYALVRIGAEVVAGWAPPYGGLGLARLAP
jgi:hypothetical protein